MRNFMRERQRGYIGVSWGKDSVVIAGLAAEAGLVSADWPLVWVRVEPMYNPDCPAVRDAFLARYAVPYEEIVVTCECDEHGWIGTGRLEQGFRIAAARFGQAYVSGVRGEESGRRAQRMVYNGTDTVNTCAPIGWQKGEDVFACLYARRLPVHPAYAMTMGGLLDRRRIRVSSIGGERGRGHGRREWERAYYPETVRAVEQMAAAWATRAR